MILNEDQIRRMIDLSGLSMGSSGVSGGGGGSIPAGSFVTPEYYSQNFGLLYKQVTTDGTTSEVTTEYLVAEPNEIPTEGTETDPTSGDVVVTTIIGQLAKNALVIGNIMLVYDQTNNAIKVVNRDGATAANFYATGGVSALGYSPGGGGGGDTLTEPLASINEASLGMPTAAGQVITWNGTQWIFDIPQGGGGGGGTGSVTSITAGTGLSGGTITTMGTIAISSAYQGYISHGETAYGWGNHADAGYATEQWVNQQGFLTSSAISDMATKTWVGQQGFLTSSAISDMATKTWVEDQGYVTSSGVTSVGLSMPTGFSVSGSPVTTSGTLSVGIASGYFIPTTTQRTTWNGKQDAISDLSTIRSGAAAGATAVQPSAISDMATQTWVNNQGFVTLGTEQTITATKTFSAYQDMKGINLDPTGDIRETTTNYGTFYLGYNAGGGNGFNLYNSLGGYLISGLSNGNVGIGNRAPAYNLDVTGNIHTTSAYYLDGILLANNNSGLHFGYGFAAADLPTTIWGNGISFRSSDGNYGSCTNIGDTYGIMGTDFIGVTNKFRFEYDSTNNTVWVLKADGTPVNFASMGGVSALGVGSSGTPSIDSLRVTRIYFDATKYLEVSGSTLRYYNGSSYITIA